MDSLAFAIVSSGLMTSVCLPLLYHLLRHYAVLDVPNARSLHQSPTVRGAGLALSVGMVVGFLVVGDVPWALWLAVIGFAGLGAADDFRRRAVSLRLVLQVALALGVSAGLTRDYGSVAILAISGGALLIVATVNATNFMDGINGVTALQAVIWGLVYAAMLIQLDRLGLAGAGLVLASVSICFLPWNFPRARMFLGDSGSYVVGATVGALALAVSTQGAVLAALCPLATYAADTSFTILRRLTQRESITQPHREHVFQQLVARGWSHTRTALVVTSFSGVSASLGFTALLSDDRGRVDAVMIATVLALNAVYLLLPNLVSRRQSALRSGS